MQEIDAIQLNIKAKLDELSEIILDNAGTYREYNDEDLFNACQIFQGIIIAKMWDKHKDKLSIPQMEELATECGKSIRQTVLLFTGKDMHKVVRKLLSK